MISSSPLMILFLFSWSYMCVWKCTYIYLDTTYERKHSIFPSLTSLNMVFFSSIHSPASVIFLYGQIKSHYLCVLYFFNSFFQWWTFRPGPLFSEVYLLLWYVYAHGYMCALHHVEVRKQLWRISPLFLLKSSALHSRCFYLLGHLIPFLVSLLSYYK